MLLKYQIECSTGDGANNKQKTYSFYIGNNIKNFEHYTILIKYQRFLNI